MENNLQFQSKISKGPHKKAMLCKSLSLQWEGCTNDNLAISKALEMAKLHRTVDGHRHV